jgi:3-oxoacyl-[acyl-carrier protein] reductase
VDVARSVGLDDVFAHGMLSMAYLGRLLTGGAPQERLRPVPVGVNPGLLAVMEQLIPLGRAGTPADAAGAVYLLCIPESDYVSAQTLICGGGFFG